MRKVLFMFFAVDFLLAVFDIGLSELISNNQIILKENKITFEELNEVFENEIPLEVLNIK